MKRGSEEESETVQTYSDLHTDRQTEPNYDIDLRALHFFVHGKT